jgi:hypothetical protein
LTIPFKKAYSSADSTLKLPYTAPSNNVGIGNSPLGARHGSRALTMGQEPHLATSDDNGSAQE